MQWRHPLSLSLTTPQTLTPPSPPSTQLNTSSNIPFRELLLQQQQQNHQSDIKRSLDNFSTIATSLAAAAAAANTGTNTTNSMIAATTERERNALATHFQERDRLILQHQQQQLQQQQKKEQMQRLEQEREKCLNNNDRIHDYVIGGDRDRTNAGRGKTPGRGIRILYYISSFLLFHFVES